MKNSNAKIKAPQYPSELDLDSWHYHHHRYYRTIAPIIELSLLVTSDLSGQCAFARKTSLFLSIPTISAKQHLATALSP